MVQVLRTAAFSVIALCICMPACQKADKRINKGNYDKIQSGMTLAQVEEMLGGPGEANPEVDDVAQVSGGAAAAGVTTMDLGATKSPITWYKWGTSKVYILVAFKRDNQVAASDFKREKGLK